MLARLVVNARRLSCADSKSITPVPVNPPPREKPEPIRASRKTPAQMSDRCIGRQEIFHQFRQGHQKRGCHQGALAAEAVAPMTEQECVKRPRRNAAPKMPKVIASGDAWSGVKMTLARIGSSDS
jgi:hypothetical protein